MRPALGCQAGHAFRDQLLPDRDAVHPVRCRGVFLYPIALELRVYGSFALAETIVFILLLFVAFIYVWRRGALQWK